MEIMAFFFFIMLSKNRERYLNYYRQAPFFFFIFLWMISICGFILFKGNHRASSSLGQHQNFDLRKERKNNVDNVGRRCGASKSRAATCVGALCETTIARTYPCI
jgi:hypothetical protein